MSLRGQKMIQGWQGNGSILKDLRQYSTHSEKYDRSKIPIIFRAHDDFIIRRLEHGLDGDPLYSRFWVVGVCMLQNVFKSRRNFLFISYVEADTLGIRFMGDVPGIYFHDNRKTHICLLS